MLSTENGRDVMPEPLDPGSADSAENVLTPETLRQAWQRLQQQEANLSAREAKLARETAMIARISRVAFERRGNPLFVWCAIQALGPQAELPAWIRSYLDRVAGELTALCERSIPPDKATDRVAGVLGLARHGWNAFADMHVFEDDGRTALELVSVPGQRKAAMYEIATKHDVSERTVARRLRRANVQLVAELQDDM